jgi:hypothetical protein
MTETVDPLRLMPQKLKEVMELATQHTAMSELIGLDTHEQIEVMSAELAGNSEYLQRVYSLKQENPEKQRTELFKDYCQKIQGDVAKELLKDPQNGVKKLYASYTAPYTEQDVDDATKALELIKSTSNMGNLRVMVNTRKDESGDTHSLTDLPKINAMCDGVNSYVMPTTHMIATPRTMDAAVRG